MLVGLLTSNGRTSRERFDRSPRFSFCKGKVVPCLQVHPELWVIAKPVGKPQCRVAGYPTLALDDLSNPIGGDAELTRQLSRRHTDGLKPLGENLSRVMDCCSHIAPRIGRAVAPAPHAKNFDDVRQSYITFAYSATNSLPISAVSPMPLQPSPGPVERRLPALRSASLRR